MAAQMSSSSAPESCLFMAEWEVVRVQIHGVRRQHAEQILCDIQLRARGGLAALDAWSTVLEARKALEEAAASAAIKATSELEARWRPVRVDAHDGEAAAWLLAAERAHAEARAASAKRWAVAAPADCNPLKRRHQALVDSANGSLPEVVRAWDAAHEAAVQAWQAHNERLESTARAVAEERAPPDSWLSEVRYRERARAVLVQQAATERLLEAKAMELVALEVDRARVWGAFASSYSAACNGFAASPEAAAMASMVLLPSVPTVRLPGGMPPSDAPLERPLPQIPDMPSAGGAVLQRMLVAMQAPAGLFGLGGGGWRDGAILVLTLHGYLHLFYSDAGSTSSKPATEDNAAAEDEELVESAIRASVYVPMATKCMFLQKGKELVCEVSEPTEAAPAGSGSSSGAAGGGGGLADAAASPVVAAGSSTPGSGSGGLGAAASAASSGLRRLLSRSPTGLEPVPRRVYARVANAAEFRELEGRCHEFVRRGQGLRAAVAAAAAAAAKAQATAAPDPRAVC
mmetsp:Transcript_123330/g.308076  ORF Transcript_123330/g.308076 Transcript_123330/m.308076 type:complete len:517 (+) Transcript_123330:160-1710(+)